MENSQQKFGSFMNACSTNFNSQYRHDKLSLKNNTLDSNKENIIKSTYSNTYNNGKLTPI